MKTLLLVLTLLPLFIFGQSLTPPTISHETGFYENEFKISITHPDTNVTILYTLDGSEPAIDNLTGREWHYKNIYTTNPGGAIGDLIKDTIWTYTFSDSLLIRDRSGDSNRTSAIATSVYNHFIPSENVFKGTVLKVVAYFDNKYSEVIIRNYFIDSQGYNRYNFPIISISVDSDKMYGYENGLNVPGMLFDEWRINNPTEPFFSKAPANYQAEGSSSEFKVHFSYIKQGVELINQHAGIRLNGNATRFYPNRAIRLYAKSSYGSSSFKALFFDDYAFNKFKRLVLRNSGNDDNRTLFRDAFTQNLVKNLNVDIQESQPVILFINSEYDGIRNLRTKYDEKYFEMVYNIDEDSLDHIEGVGIVETGDTVFYEQMMNFYQNNSLTDNAKYRQALTYLDHINFTDAYITNIFIANADWPHNNNEYWRKRVPLDTAAPYGHDGRFRWIIKDTDFGFDLAESKRYKFNAIDWATRIEDPTEPDAAFYNNSTLLLRKLLENSEYKDFFLNRFADLLNTTFTTDRILTKINYFKELYRPEIVENNSRWPSFCAELDKWEDYVDVLSNFAINRPLFQREQLVNKFELDGLYDLVLDVSDTTHGHIHLNTIDILSTTDGIASNPYIWIGNYFKNVPITLKAIERPGYVFTHWSGDVNDTLAEITLALNRDTYIKANFKLYVEEEIDDLGVNNVSFEAKEMTVYPNPFSNHINILMDVYDGDYAIYAITGQLMKQGQLSSQKISLEDLEKGIFILKVTSGGNTFRHRIIKK